MTSNGLLTIAMTAGGVIVIATLLAIAVACFRWREPWLAWFGVIGASQAAVLGLVQLDIAVPLLVECAYLVGRPVAPLLLARGLWLLHRRHRHIVLAPHA